MQRHLLGLLVSAIFFPIAAQNKIVWTDAEKPISEDIRGLRRIGEESRGRAITRLALEIRRLPDSPNKLRLAYSLAVLSTEGDFGRTTLEEVASTLALSLQQQPQADVNGEPADHYVQLAEFARYEGIRVSLDSPAYTAALAKLEALDRQRASVDFQLRDIEGKEWKLSALRGSVILVNFWATWCPPCRVELPDLEDVYSRFRKKGLVILAISDETPTKIVPFAKEGRFRFPILLDPDRSVSKLFGIEAIPKSFLYDREGNLVATAIDRRTKSQLLGMLAKVGLK